MDRELENSILKLNERMVGSLINAAWRRGDHRLSCDDSAADSFIKSSGLNALNYFLRVRELHRLETLSLQKKSRLHNKKKFYKEENVYDEVSKSMVKALFVVKKIKNAGGDDIIAASLLSRIQMANNDFKKLVESVSLKPVDPLEDIFGGGEVSKVGHPQTPMAVHLARAWIFLAVSKTLPNLTDVSIRSACKRLLEVLVKDIPDFSVGYCASSFRDSYRVFKNEIVKLLSRGLFPTSEVNNHFNQDGRLLHSKLFVSSEAETEIVQLYLEHESIDEAELYFKNVNWFENDLYKEFSDISSFNVNKVTTMHKKNASEEFRERVEQNYKRKISELERHNYVLKQMCKNLARKTGEKIDL